MKKNFLQWLPAAAALGLFAVILTRIAAGAPALQPAQQSHATSSLPRVNQENGHAVIQLDPGTQARLGIGEAPLKAARQRKQMALPAVVLPVQNLAGLVSAYNAAFAQMRKAEITAKVSGSEYQRLKALYRDRQNVSQKAVQSAAGIYHGDEVDVQLARENLTLAATAVLQNWGEAVTGWMAHNANGLQRVLSRQDVLVDVTLPPGGPFTAPPEVEFNLPAGGRAIARLVSAFPQIDPRVQGVGYIYVTRARPGLAPGLNLIAHFGMGALRSGVIVPSGAVVWWHGEAWAYVATAPGRFVRHRVPTDIRAPGGWVVAHGFAPGGSVVIRGAQQILAVELMPTPSSQPAGGEGSGN